MASIGGFFKSLGHGLKVIFGNPTVIRLEAGVASILLPGFSPLINSAANAIINAEAGAIAAGVQSGTGVQKFAYALSQFGPVYEAWAKENNITVTDTGKQAFLQKVFELLQMAPEITQVITGQQAIPVPTGSGQTTSTQIA